MTRATHEKKANEGAKVRCVYRVCLPGAQYAKKATFYVDAQRAWALVWRDAAGEWQVAGIRAIAGQDTMKQRWVPAFKIINNAIRKDVEATLRSHFKCRGFSYEARYEEMGEGEDADEISDVHFADADEVNWSEYEVGTHETCWTVWGKVNPSPEQLARIQQMDGLGIMFNEDGTYDSKMGDLYITIRDGAIIRVES